MAYTTTRTTRTFIHTSTSRKLQEWIQGLWLVPCLAPPGMVLIGRWLESTAENYGENENGFDTLTQLTENAGVVDIRVSAPKDPEYQDEDESEK